MCLLPITTSYPFSLYPMEFHVQFTDDQEDSVVERLPLDHIVVVTRSENERTDFETSFSQLIHSYTALFLRERDSRNSSSTMYCVPEYHQEDELSIFYE